MTSPKLGTLSDVEHESGVNEKGVPFVRVRAVGVLSDGSPVALVGQLDPEGVRQAALAEMTAAEAAVSDAAVFRLMQERFDLSEQNAGMLVADLRNFRADMPDGEDDGGE